QPGVGPHHCGNSAGLNVSGGRCSTWRRGSKRRDKMFGIRGWWSRHGDAIKAKLDWITNPTNREKAARAVSTSINLMEQAMPYVKMIASLTPTTADDILLAAAAKIGVKIEDIISEPDWHRKVGL